ncbi:MAG: hypothetical protein KDD22_03990, partial [Bdellovibrionales bacterium]|nr:hypothetical protein [Bdellovibrionales bacterium]
SSTDELGTPYKAAFNFIRETIKKDLLTADEKTQYLVAFITDGYPTDYCPDPVGIPNCKNDFDESVMFNDLKTVLKTAKDRIQFGAVYYGPPDEKAAARLRKMADLGGGQFVDTNKDDGIKLDDVITVPKPSCE